MDSELSSHVNTEDWQFAGTYGTEEAVEGRNAFMEKRPPDFNRFRK